MVIETNDLMNFLKKLYYQFDIYNAKLHIRSKGDNIPPHPDRWMQYVVFDLYFLLDGRSEHLAFCVEYSKTHLTNMFQDHYMIEYIFKNICGLLSEKIQKYRKEKEQHEMEIKARMMGISG